MGQFKIQNGDTLGSLARRYKTSVAALTSLNKLANSNRISAGSTLEIPGYSGSNTAVTPKASTPAPPTDPTEKWLAGDSTYQGQLANYNKTKADYEAQWGVTRANTDRDYNISNRALQDQGVTDRDTQINDYAGRGVVNSGVYGTALSDYNKNFNTKVQNLLQGKTDSVSNQENSKTNFLRQLQFEMDQARQDAIRRRAQQLGI